MLPASLIEWLTGLTKYEITSMINNIGLNARGALLIQNRLKILAHSSQANYCNCNKYGKCKKPCYSDMAGIGKTVR